MFALVRHDFLSAHCRIIGERVGDIRAKNSRCNKNAFAIRAARADYGDFWNIPIWSYRFSSVLMRRRVVFHDAVSTAASSDSAIISETTEESHADGASMRA